MGRAALYGGACDFVFLIGSLHYGQWAITVDDFAVGMGYVAYLDHGVCFHGYADG